METSNDSGQDSGMGAWWWAAGGVIALVVLGLVWVLVGPRSSEEAPPVGASPPPVAVTPSGSSSGGATPTGEPSAAGWPDAGCHGATAAPVPPAQALTDLSWEPVLTSALPTSKKVGPSRVDGGVRTCYQHSPAGALMAAVNINVSLFVPDQGEKVVEAQVTPGPGQDDRLAAVARSDGQPGNIVGYRVGACVPARCNVEVVTSGQGVYGAGLVPMVWSGGDWKIDGSIPSPSAGLVQGIPQGFTPWGASS